MNASDTPWIFEGWRFPIFFCLLWVAICGLLSVWSGWFSLAKEFAGRLSEVWASSSFQSGAMGWRYLAVSYANCLFVKVGPDGIGLSILWPFRVLAPPIAIPWRLVQSLEDRPWWKFGGVKATLKDHSQALTLYGKAGRIVREAYARSSGKTAP